MNYRKAGGWAPPIQEYKMKRITKKEQEAAKTIRAAAQKALDGGFFLDTRRVWSWDGAVVFKLVTWMGGYYLWSLSEIERLQEYLPALMCITSVSPAIEIYADLDLGINHEVKQARIIRAL